MSVMMSVTGKIVCDIHVRPCWRWSCLVSWAHFSRFI